MKKTLKDHIGQEIVVGDWAAVTQHNTIYVGKVIKANSSVTIAINSKEEFMQTNKEYLKLKNYIDKTDFLRNTFGKRNGSGLLCGPGWARDGKFIKIEPTDEMLVNYDIIKE